MMAVTTARSRQETDQRGYQAGELLAGFGRYEFIHRSAVRISSPLVCSFDGHDNFITTNHVQTAAGR